MAVGYGSSVQLPTLTRGEIGSYTLTEKKEHGLPTWAHILRWLIVAAEVGTAFIPGIGPGISTGIAIAAQGAQTAIDAQFGQITPIGQAIGWASVLIPGITHGIGNIRAGSKLIKFGEELETKSIKALARADRWHSFDRASGEFRLTTLGRQKLLGDARNVASFADAKTVSNLQSTFAKSLARGEAAQRIGARTHFFSGVERTTAKQIKATSEWAASLPTNSIFKPMVTAEGEAARNIAANWPKYIAVGRTSGEVADETAEQVVKKMLAKSGLTASEIDLILANIFKVGGFELSGKAAGSLLINELKSLGKSADEIAQITTKFTNEASKAGLKQSWLETTRAYQKSPKRVQKILKASTKPNTSEFNDAITQKVQLLFDDDDLGRAGAEKAYQVIKEKLDGRFKKLAEWWKKWKNRGKSLDKIWTEGGGILVNSQVILGYKIIQSVGFQSLICIQFYPEATNKKPPVYVTATKTQLKRLQSDGMKYYLKKWAVSRGGKSVGIGSFGLKGLSNKAQIVMAFIPVQGLKNILSITSNVVENVFSKGFGKGPQTPGGLIGLFAGNTEVAELGKVFKRTGASRLSRLLGRGVIGGAARVFLGDRVGAFIGTEAQRLGSIFFASGLKNKIEGRNWDGSGWYTAKNGKQRWHKPTKNSTTIRNAVMTSSLGHLKKGAKRKNPNSVILGTFSAKRKSNLLGRIPSSITPDKSINPRNIRKLKFG